MILILKKQKTTSEKQLEIMQETLTNYLNLMQEQEKKNKEELENLSKEILNNTQKGINLLEQEIGNLKDELTSNIKQIFNKMHSQVDRLKQNIKYTEFKDKVATAFPIAVLASLFTLLLNWIISYFL